jgi:hypothetical protein
VSVLVGPRLGEAALTALVATSLLVAAGSSADAKNEKHWQRLYCAGMELEHRLADGARIDCLNAEYAIEVDYVDHWAESIGQALYYASATKRKPGIILLCPSSTDERIYGGCLRDLYRLDGALSEVDKPVTVWACVLDQDVSLATCKQTVSGSPRSP